MQEDHGGKNQQQQVCAVKGGEENNAFDNTAEIQIDYVGQRNGDAAADGHPVEIMDMSFAMQAIAAEHILKNHKNLENKVYNIPEEQDRYVAELKLKSFGGSFDTLNEKQKAYMAGH